MMDGREFGWLHTLQCNLAAKRDWIAVAHLQALIDHIAENHIMAADVAQWPEIRDQIH